MQKHSNRKTIYQISGVLSILVGIVAAWYAAQLYVPLSAIVFVIFVVLAVVLFRVSGTSKN
jgi:heme/copper-type cytochrome/quinol oxidase subunit 4